MSNAPATTPPAQRPRVLFLGMRCAFSVPPLQALIAAGTNIIGVLLPGVRDAAPAAISSPVRGVPMASLKLAGPVSVDIVARAAGIPIGSLRGSCHGEAADLIRALQPDVIAVACFPWKLPTQLLEIPPLGCVNVHPSLLPRWRGPEPLFWTFRSGDPFAGVTVHKMDAGFDTGAILAQSRIEISPGISGRDLEHRLSVDGGELLVRVIGQLAAGATSPQLQSETEATHARTPTDDDLIISVEQSAHRVFNYVRGIAPLWGAVPVHVPSEGVTLLARDALDVDPAGVLETAITYVGNRCLVRCRPGVVMIELAD